MTQEHLLDRVLACPVCHHDLMPDRKVILCSSCGARFPQTNAAVINLLSSEVIPGSGEWQQRQALMHDWYAKLAESPDDNRYCYLHDYRPLAGILSRLPSPIADVGGGYGVTRAYLRPATEYVVVEPSVEWLSLDYSDLRELYPVLSTTPAFVLGTGESVPLRTASMASALSLWSLNHVNDPAKVIAEMARVVRPGGSAVIVLEDMEPSWADVLYGAMRRGGRRWALRSAQLKASAARTGRPMPIQDDHIRIQEADFTAWLAGRFGIVQRTWLTGYLTFVLQRLSD